MMDSRGILLLCILLLSTGCLYDPNLISSKPARVRSFCGDAVVDKSSGEECDDGNQVDGDGCDKNCKLPLTVVTPQTYCGNGYIESGEECDDGNQVDGDGCSKKCKIEDGYTCSGFSDGGKQKDIVLHIRFNKLFAHKAEALNGDKADSRQHDANLLEEEFEKADCLNGKNNPVAHIMPADKSLPPSSRAVGHPQLARDSHMVCNEFEKSIFERWNLATRQPDSYADQDIVLEKGVKFSLYTPEHSGKKRYVLAKAEDDHRTYAKFYPLDGFIQSLRSGGTEFAKIYDYASDKKASNQLANYYLAEFRVWFKYDPTSARDNPLIFNGDDDYWVFINGIQVENFIDPSTPVKTWGDHAAGAATQLKVSLDADAVKDGLAFNSKYHLVSGQVYEIAYFLINRGGTGALGISLPEDIVGPSYCSKCGNGIVEYGEACETSYMGKENSQCDASCQVKDTGKNSCGYLPDNNGMIRSLCQSHPQGGIMSLRRFDF